MSYFKISKMLIWGKDHMEKVTPIPSKNKDEIMKELTYLENETKALFSMPRIQDVVVFLDAREIDYELCKYTNSKASSMKYIVYFGIHIKSEHDDVIFTLTFPEFKSMDNPCDLEWPVFETNV